jgi:hypothetical protein
LLPATVTLGAPLTILSANNRYPDDGSGTGVYLTGSHVWSNLQDEVGQTAVNFDDYLDTLDGYSHNFTRGWHWEEPRYTPLPYTKTSGKYNLDTYYATYFNRLKNRADDCADKGQGIYLGIMLFEGWSVEDKDGVMNPNPWNNHPYKSGNNNNSINGDPNSDGQGVETHTLDISAVTSLQEDYVEHLIDQLNAKDNIVWQISNESWSGSSSWEYHIIDHIKSYEAGKAKQHLVWMEGYEIPNSDLFVSNADILSPNKFNGDTHYRGNPQKNTTGRIVCLDTDHLWGVGGDWAWVWRAFTRGYHPIYMDPLYPLVWHNKTWDPDDYIDERKAMGVTRKYAERLDFSVVVPKNARASSNNCLCKEGEQYLAYQRTAGADLTIQPLASGEFYYEWVDPIEGTLHETGTVTGNGTNKVFNNPTSNQEALYIVNIDDGVTVDLGYFNDVRGLIAENGADGENKGTTIGGRHCRTQTNTSTEHYLYCDIENDWAYQGSKTDVYVTIEYYDVGSGFLRLQYDCTDGTKYKIAGNVDIDNTSTWKTKTWHLTDAYFGNRENLSSDMRIYKSNNEAYYLDKVSVSEDDPSPGPPDPATNPSPANAATDQTLSVDLSWTAGAGADSHDVYFGTDSTPDAGEFKGNQTGVTYDPGTLSANTTYYWRIDEVNTNGTTTGTVWSFTTYGSPGAASNPSPANSATDVSTSTNLSWTAGANAESHDVYFGTDSTPDAGEFQGNQAGTNFDPGTLSISTNYYWRIDEVNQAGTTTGTVWSFTTTSSSVTVPTVNVLDAGTITIDGNTGDWNLSEFTSLTKGGVAEQGDIALTGYDSSTLYYASKATESVEPTSASDHTAKVYSRHNSAYQYFLVRCDDDDIQTDEGTQGDNWKNDCVEIYIDPSHNHGSSSMSNSTSDIQLVIDAANRQNVYMCTSGYKTQVLNGVTSAVSTDANGWYLEVRIEKTALDPDMPGLGDLGVDFNYRDNDDSNNMTKTTVYSWSDDSGTGFPSKIPDNWGDAVLENEAIAVPTVNVKAAGTITIDGSTSDWSLGDFTTNARGGQAERGDIALTGYVSSTLYYGGYWTSGTLPTSASDHTAKVYCRENSTYQYFLVRCDDDDIQTDEGTQGDNWKNDCVEFYIDPSHNGGSTSMSDSTSDIQLVIDAANRQNVYMCTSGYKSQVLGGVTSAVSTDANGWYLEVRITKSVLDPDIPDTGIFGVDFNFRDNDNSNDPTKTTIYIWSDPESGTGFPSKIPDNWGDAAIE